MPEWEVVRRQVAVCGRVTRDDGVPVGDAVISVEPRAARADAVRTRRDGIYFVLDLPDGEYVSSIRDPRTGVGDHGRGRVARDAAGNVRFAVVDLALVPRNDRRPARRGRTGTGS
jgi:hypothetical protein